VESIIGTYPTSDQNANLLTVNKIYIKGGRGREGVAMT
jgi:hypothetical protein